MKNNITNRMNKIFENEDTDKEEIKEKLLLKRNQEI